MTPVEIRVNLGVYTYGWWIEGHRTGDHFHQGSRKGTVSSSLTQAGWGFLQSFARSSLNWLSFIYFVMRKQGNENLVVGLDFKGKVISPSQTGFWTPSTSRNQKSCSKLWNHKGKSRSLTSKPFPFQLTLLGVATNRGLGVSVICTMSTPCKGEGKRIEDHSIWFLSTRDFSYFC